MPFRTLLDHEWYMTPALKEIAVEPPVTTSSIDRQKEFVSKMFTQKVPAVEWCVRTGKCDRGNLGNYFDKFISFYSKSLKNHCSRNKMKTKRKLRSTAVDIFGSLCVYLCYHS